MGIIKSIAISAITALGFNLYSGSSPAQNYLPGTLPDGSQPLNLEERISNKDILDKVGPLKSGDFVSDSMGSGNWYGIAVIDKTKSGVGHPVKVGEELHRTERLKSL